MKPLLMTIAALTIASAPAYAAPCKDAKGRFTKCPTTSAAASTGVTKDKNGRCHKGGRFVKCPA